MPCRRSQVRSSKPCSEPRGNRTTASSLTTGALRRRTAERQLELHRLVDTAGAKAADSREDALLEHADSWLGSDHRGHARGTIDLGRERASVERREASAAPPPPCTADEQRADHEHSGARSRSEDQKACEQYRPRCRGLDANQIREAQAAHRPSRNDVRGKHFHGTTSPCNSARRAGPMPGMASSPSTELNAPCCWR